MSDITEARARFIAARGGRNAQKIGGARRSNAVASEVTPQQKARQMDRSSWTFVRKTKLHQLGNGQTAIFSKAGGKDVFVIDNPNVEVSRASNLMIVEGVGRKMAAADVPKPTPMLDPAVMQRLMAAQAPTAGEEDLAIDDDDEVPELVDDFEEHAKAR